MLTIFLSDSIFNNSVSELYFIFISGLKTVSSIFIGIPGLFTIFEGPDFPWGLEYTAITNKSPSYGVVPVCFYGLIVTITLL